MGIKGLRRRGRLLVLVLAPGAALLAQPAATATATAAGVTHGAFVRNTAETSTNWSGYDSTSGPFDSVSASWTQPSVKCATGSKKTSTSYAAFWVGLDGDGSNTVEQTGTDSDCVKGSPRYYGWYEMYPAAPVNYSNTVLPGDLLSASVTTNGTGSFTLVLTDQTQSWSITQQKSLSSAKLFSAEVIAEAPSSGKVLPLADFGTIDFTSAMANGQPIGNESPNEITMASGSTVKAQPSALSSGENFSVTWEAAG